jgi:phosphoglycolate phosphatase-like HAD superfamily hydrolase
MRSASGNFASFPTPPRIEHFDIPEAVVLDFDRTLGIVENCKERLYLAAGACGLSTGHIKDAGKQVENDGGSFDPLTFVQDALDTDAYEAFCNRFIAVSEENKELPVLYDDAYTLLGRLQHSDTPYYIMTYGVNEEWQRLKIVASGHPVGCTIMSTSDKGKQIESEDTFGLRVAAHGTKTEYTADAMVLIDDKAVAFNGLAKDCKGFFIQRGELMPSQRGTLPPNVQTIHSLEELIPNDAGILLKGGDESRMPYRAHRSSYDRQIRLFQPAYKSLRVWLPEHPNVVVRENPWTNPKEFNDFPVQECYLDTTTV